ncbi:MAG: hypothetical protein Q7S52_02055 [bacterium]|nr:hypothetical protein [bacterium]
MTCIVAVTNGKRIVIGGDSAGVGGYSLTVRKDKKVFKRSDESKTFWLFGFTSSFRMGQLIQYELKLPPVDSNAREDLYGFMVTKFIPSLRECLKSGGYAEKKYEVETGGTFIVGLLGRIFEIENDYQVAEHSESFTAVGCGHDLAKGSLYTSRRSANLHARVRQALEAAERFSAGVRGPFEFVQTG